MNGVKRFCFGLIVLLLLLAGAQAAFGIWSKTANATGYGKAVSMPTGNTPTVSVSGTDVTVSWAQSAFSGGTPVAGYLARRYDASTNALQTIGSACSGTISALTCTETSVPDGTWKYTVTPKQNSWTGAESAKSTVVTVSPTVSSTSPSSRGQGASSQSITITGTGFVSGASASFSGTGITVNSTSFVSSTSLTANITVSSSASTGSRNVTVTNPDAGSGSCSSCFTVNAAPTVSSTSPSSRGQGASSQSITITGTGFVSGASASFSGTGITVNSTSFVSSTSLTANITVSSNASTGSRNVTVTNPDAGSGSCSSCFTVNAAPTVSSTSPSSRGQGASSQSITITGTGFVSGASLAASFGGNGITVNSTTFVSATQVSVNISISSSASVGTGNVTLTNGDAGTGTGSCSNCFTVNAAPTVSSTSPSSRGQGVASQSITINGSNFVSGATVSFGSGITVNSTSFVSATQLTANITVSSSASTGSRNVTVTNPDAGNGSCSGCFTVNAAPTITFPTSSSQEVVQNGQTVTFTLTGTGFQSGVTVTISGGFTVNNATFTDSSHISVTVKAGSGNPNKGTYDLTVANPDAGTMTSVRSIVNQ